MSSEIKASVSMIPPLKATVLHSLARKQEDSPSVRDIKVAVTKNLQDLYSTCDFLHKCTALDPRFKALPYVDDGER